MNLLSVIPCIFLLGTFSYATTSITTSVIEGPQQAANAEGPNESRVHSMKKRNADPFFHLLFGFGRNRHRKPKHHKEVHLHVVHPPILHNEIIHHGGEQESFDLEPPSWFEADEYGNPHQEGHFNYEGFGPWSEGDSHDKPHHESHDKPHHESHGEPHQESHGEPHHESHDKPHHESHDKPHHESLEEGPHFGNPVSTFESPHEGDHLPPIHIDPHEGDHLPPIHIDPHHEVGYLRPPPLPKRPPKLLQNDFHPSPLIEEINFKPLMIHYSHDSNEFLPKPHSFIHHSPSNSIEEIPHSNQKLKHIANNSIYRGDYPKRNKFNPFDKITSGLDPAGVKGVDPDTMAFIRDKIVPLANAKR